MAPGSNLSKFARDVKRKSPTHLHPLLNHLQGVNRFPCSADDTEDFQPEQKLLLQEVAESGCNCRYVDGVLVDEVFVPRLAGVLQGGVDILFDPLVQVFDLRIRNGIWEFAHVLLQCSIH